MIGETHYFVTDIGDAASDALQVARVVRCEAQNVRCIASQEEEVDAESHIPGRGLQRRDHSSILPGHAVRMQRVHTELM